MRWCYADPKVASLVFEQARHTPVPFPAIYKNHRNIRLAFKRGYLYALSGRWNDVPVHYCGETTLAAYLDGWRYGLKAREAMIATGNQPTMEPAI